MPYDWARVAAESAKMRLPGVLLHHGTDRVQQETYGLFVTQACRDAGVPYDYGERTVIYTALALL